VKNYEAEKDAARKRDRKKKLSKDERKKIKLSTNDPQARLMKMPNGGYSLAMNCEFAMDTKTGFIVGAKATNRVNDSGQLGIMFDYIKTKYGKTPKRYLSDSGFRNHNDIQKLFENDCEVYMPVCRREQKIRIKNSEGVVKWKERMMTEDAQEIYSRRASTIEWFNAGARYRGLERLTVRGLKKTQAICTLHSLAHNVQRLRFFNLI
jgi:Transposase DDE domain